MRYPEKVEKEILTQRLLFDSMIRQLRVEIICLPAKRTRKNLTYSMEDIGLGAFSVFFTQGPFIPVFSKINANKQG